MLDQAFNREGFFKTVLCFLYEKLLFIAFRIS